MLQVVLPVLLKVAKLSSAAAAAAASAAEGLKGLPLLPLPPAALGNSTDERVALGSAGYGSAERSSAFYVERIRQHVPCDDRPESAMQR